MGRQTDALTPLIYISITYTMMVHQAITTNLRIFLKKLKKVGGTFFY